MIRKLPSKFLMAPIAEITTPAFRKTVRRFSKNVILHSEMLSAASLVRGGMKNRHMLLKNKCDDPFVYQLLGNCPDMMSQACGVLTESESCLGIDLNMGCSAPDIIKKGSGSVLLSLENFNLVRQIVCRCRAILKNHNLSVKIRSGYPDYDAEYLLNFCRMLQDEGVDYITIHPRTGKQAFKRTADWSIVSLLKRELTIAVFGNGDIQSAEKAEIKMNDTGCDGIMIGRKAVQEPWIFALCDEVSEITVDLYEIALEIILEIERILPVEYHKSRMHRFLAYYFGNLTFGHSSFSAIRASLTAAEIVNVLNDYFNRNPGERTATFTKSGRHKF